MSPVAYCDRGPNEGMWMVYTLLYLTDGERDMLDRPGLALIAKGFPLLASDDDVKTDLELTCGTCGEPLCDAEAGDDLDTLARVAAGHSCLRTPSGTVITRYELDELSGDVPGAVNLVPCPEHLDYDRRCAVCRIVPTGGAS